MDWKKIGFWAFLALLCAYFIFLFLPGLGSYPFRDWDESIYVQVARESTHPLVFTWKGYGLGDQQFWFEKPPLLIWMIQGSFLLFGVGEWAARLPVVLFGLGVVMFIAWWVRRVTDSKFAGLLTGATFFVCSHFLIMSGVVNMDIPLTFFAVMSLFGYVFSTSSRKYWFIFWSGLALGVLTKNIVGLFPLLVVSSDLMLSRRWKNVLQLPEFRWGAMLFLLIVLPWHLAETFKFGLKFWETYLSSHVLQRFALPLDSNFGPWWSYLEVFTQMPYGLLSVLGLFWGSIQAFRGVERYRVPVLTVLVYFFLFSAAKTKATGYIVVVYPFLSVLIGFWLYQMVGLVKRKYLFPSIAAVLLTIFVVYAYNFNLYRQVKMQGQRFADIVQITHYLQQYCLNCEISYIGLFSSKEIVDSRVALVYYLDTVVSAGSREDVLLKQQPKLRLPTHQLFVGQDRALVLAVRDIP